MVANIDQLKILILGYGEMGHAMEYLLKNRHKLQIWEKYPEPGFRSADLEEAAAEAEMVIFCLPVNPHREVITQILPLLRSNCLCISIAKGLDEAGQTAAEIFADVLGENHHYALLYGPMISEEIRAHRYAFAELGIRDVQLFERIQECFKDTLLYIEHTEDISGISWSVILKNVYALIFGMADELQLGDNMRGYLSVAALREMSQIVHLKGGKKDSPYHHAGLGDLITTATSEDSHHHTLGRMLARGETNNITGEGIHTLDMVIKHRLFDVSQFPLLLLIQHIVKNPENVAIEIHKYLNTVYGR